VDKIGVVVTAGGIGRRFGGDKPKQFLEIAGIPVLILTLKRILRQPLIAQVVLTVPENYLQVAGELLSRYNLAGVAVTAGGSTRRESVSRGLAQLEKKYTIVAVHDSVRPFFPADIFKDAVKKIKEGYAGVIPALPLRDTVKEVEDGKVVITLDRSRLYAVQTPQVFFRDALLKGHAYGEKEKLDAFDDSFLVEQTNGQVAVIPGDNKNFKITWPEDLEFAEYLFKKYFLKELADV